MKKILMLPLFMILISFAFVSAQPPFQVGSFDEGLTLEVPVIEYLNAYEDFSFNVHVYNSTNGLFIQNENLTCSIHIYSDNLNGEHIVQDLMSINENNLYDMSYTVSGELLEEGVYSNVISCNTGEVGGFFQYGFDVLPDTDKNFKFDLSKNVNLIVLIIVFIIGLIMTFWIDNVIGGFIFIIIGLILLFSSESVILPILILFAGVLIAFKK